MTKLLAKPLIKNRLWLITNGKFKVGKIEARDQGYDVHLGNKSAHYDNAASIQKLTPIEFERPLLSNNTKPFSIWPTEGKTYNDVIDIKRRLYLYTKNKNSKCYYAAGYFRVKMDGQWATHFCPKYIFLQRYEYTGPYMTEAEADSS